MKKNKKKNKCVITTLWSSLEAMKKYLFINLEEQEVFKVSNGKKFKKTILVGTGKNNKPYVVIAVEINKKSYKLRLHRLFFYWKHNYLPPIVDHIDRNSFNNNIENLRELNASQSSRNTKKRKNGTSIHKGVNWSKAVKKWVAHLSLNEKNVHIGYFEDEDDAGQAYNDKIRELGLEGTCPLNDTPQERARINNQFDPLPEEINHIKDKFTNIEPIADLK